MEERTDFGTKLLASLLKGTALAAGDPGFQEACSGFNTAHSSNPDIVVLADSTADVVAAVRHAAARDLPLSVHSTGHGYPGNTTGSMLINTSNMQELNVDPSTGTARASAGVRWDSVIAQAAPHGLAPLNGSSTDVGVIGYTLGGGMGPMGRTFGFAADHVNAIEIVVADGSLQLVTAESEPELFWALCGGKCAVGIVTHIDFNLMPVPEVYGGPIFFSPSDAATILHAYGEWVGTLPESTTASIALLRLPDDPSFPEPLRGKTNVHLRYVHVGDEESGARLLAPLLQAVTPVINLVALMPYAAIASVHQDPSDPMPAWDGSMLLQDFPAAAVDALLGAAGPAVDVPIIMAEVRHLGGAFTRGPVGGNAVGGRDAAFNFGVIAPYPPHLQEIVDAAGNEVLDALRPWAHGGTQINFQGFAATPQDVRKAWDEPTLRRLREVKAAWDPEHRFSFGYSLD